LAISERLHQLRNRLPEHSIDAIIINRPENLRYLSGFSGTEAFLFISAGDAILATDFRYVEQARAQATDFHVVQIKGEIGHWFSEFALGLKVRRLGFESLEMRFAGYQELQTAIEQMPSAAQPQLIPSRGLVESLRAIKEQGEIKLLEEAAALADAAMEQMLSKVQPGMRERQVAWELERFLRERGSEPIPFELIVASGANSALPHAQPTERPIRPDEPVVIDIGAQLGGYCSDLSRTICLGEPDQTLARIYEIVLEAQLAAVEAIAAGMSGEQVDHIARDVIEQAGYGEAFGHGLGHGVGLAPHEQPRLGPGSKDILAEGMVFTIEPGIYIKGWGGVRVEDMVVLEKGNVRLLTKAKKALRREDA
jgi:Xaa-Pro aminopeptidase